LIEESPSPIITGPLREKMGQAAVNGCIAAGYVNAGTFEFLVDADGNYFFMEANTRIQVEHPVTEEVTGLDLVKEQIKIAAGEKLDVLQKDITFTGHTFECRINAENPDKNFAPGPGKITAFHVPGGHGVRVDTHAYAGYEIPPNYDSLIAKMIVSGRNRSEAINKVLRCLDEFIVEGIPTTINFYKQVFKDSNFILGLYDNSFVEKFMAQENFESEKKLVAKEES